MPLYNFVPLTRQVEAQAHENNTISSVSNPDPVRNQTNPIQTKPPNEPTTPFPRVPNHQSVHQCSCSKQIRFKHPLLTTTYAPACTPHLTKSDFHYFNNDIKFFKFSSRVQGEVPLQSVPEWYIE